jgi:hypothetical protein
MVEHGRFVVDDLHGAVALALFQLKFAKHDECMPKSDVGQLDPISLRKPNAKRSPLQGPHTLWIDISNNAMLANLDVSPVWRSLPHLNIASQPPAMANKKSTSMFPADEET